MADVFGVGIVGYGNAGRRFHRYLIGLEPGLEIRAIVARSEERQAQARQDEPQAAVYDSLEELLADKRVDLAVVATPHSSHAGICAAALGAGRNVVVDKVMCLTVEQADRIIAARDRSGRLFSVFQNRRWDGDYLTVRQVIESGKLGEVFLIQSAIGSFYAPKRWRADRAHEGGILFDWGSHLVDQALQIDSSGVETVFCSSVDRDEPDVRTEAYAQLHLCFRSGRIALIERTNTGAIEAPRFRLLGRRGAFQKCGRDPQEQAMFAGDIRSARDPEHLWGALRYRDDAGQIVEQRVPTLPGDWPAYYRNILAALRGQAPLAVTAEQCREQVRILEASVVSARETRVVRLDEAF
jgi:scyllo-inositol 2-dehydrogenase (NADP+)